MNRIEALIERHLKKPYSADDGMELMVVVNSSKWPKDFVEHRMYCCPAAENGWAEGYRHYPARFIANYVQKGSKYIGVVEACVHLSKSGDNRVLWKYSDIGDAEASVKAEAVRSATKRNPKPCVVFLQSQLSTTDFVYDLEGGLQLSRVYFDVSSLDVIDVKDIAAKLRDIPWSTLPKRET